MNKDKKFTPFLILIFVLIFSLAGYLALTEYQIEAYIEKDLKIDEFPDKFSQYNMVECEFDFTEPKYAFLGEYKDYNDIKVFYYQMERDHIFTSDWSDDYIGGATVENVAYDEILLNLKEDCTKYQRGFGGKDPDDPKWIYTKNTEDQGLTESEIKKRVQDIRWQLEGASSTLKQKVRERYGDWEVLSDPELIEFGEMIRDEVESGAFEVNE